jgi:hypothetical protein
MMFLLLLLLILLLLFFVVDDDYNVVIVIVVDDVIVIVDDCDDYHVIIVVVVVVVVTLCQNHVFSHAQLVYKDFLKILNFHILCERNLQLDPLFLISYYLYLKCCPSLLDITGIRVFSRNFRNFKPFPATCETSLSVFFLLLLLSVCPKTSIVIGTSSRLLNRTLYNP